MLPHDFPFDTVQMPLNCLDATLPQLSRQQVLPEANGAGIAVLGMKSMGGSGEIIIHGAVTPEEALRYAMSLPVATTISGVDSMDVLQQNLAIARGFQPMSTPKCRPCAIAASYCRRRPLRTVQDHEEVRRQRRPRATSFPVFRRTARLGFTPNVR